MTRPMKNDTFFTPGRDIHAQAWLHDLSIFDTLLAERDALLSEMRHLRKTIEQWSTPAQSQAERWNSVQIPQYVGVPDVIPIASDGHALRRRSGFHRQIKLKRLRDIEARLVHTENELHRLQMRILTFEPRTADDASRLMSFMSRQSRVGHPVPADYADEILQLCAEIISSPSGPPPAAIVGL